MTTIQINFLLKILWKDLLQSTLMIVSNILFQIAIKSFLPFLCVYI